MNFYRSPFPYAAIDIDNQNEQRLFLTEGRPVDSLAKLKLGDRGVCSVNALEALYAQAYASSLPANSEGNYILILHPYASLQFRQELKYYYEPPQDKDKERIQEIFTDILGKEAIHLEQSYFGNYLGFDIFISKQLTFSSLTNSPIQTIATVEGKEVTLIHNLFLYYDAFLQAIRYARQIKETTGTFYGNFNSFFLIRECHQSYVQYTKILTPKEAF